MKEKLSKEEVMHVAKLARIKIGKEEIEKYQIELKELLDDVNKIKNVVDTEFKQLIAPWQQDAKLREDLPGKMLDPKTVLKNAPRHSGNYIEVPIVINEEV